MHFLLHLCQNTETVFISNSGEWTPREITFLVEYFYLYLEVVLVVESFVK